MTQNKTFIGILFIALLFSILLYAYLIKYRFRESFEIAHNKSFSVENPKQNTEDHLVPLPSQDFVFIMARHVNNESTDKYWKESYQHIRKSYPGKRIIIVDDNSDPRYLKNNIDLYNTEIIKSEFPGRGELLPYYYFYKNKYAQKAIIIHDSVFIQDYIDFQKINDDVMPFWHSDHENDLPEREREIIGYLDNSKELLEFYDKKEEWNLTFGVMSVIQYQFLDKIQKKYNFFKLLDIIKNRTDRMCLERIFGLICHKEYSKLKDKSSYFGSPNNWGYTFERYLNDIKDGVNRDPIVKVWTGR